jgi:hypothetical protein
LLAIVGTRESRAGDDPPFGSGGQAGGVKPFSLHHETVLK